MSLFGELLGQPAQKSKESKRVISVKKARRRSNNRRQSFVSLCTFLVFGIVGLQSVEVSELYGRLLDTPLWILPSLLIPALFTVAGFVLALRVQTLSPTILARQYSRRFLPPLVLATLISAFVIGPIVTSETFLTYFSHPEVWLFLTNIIGWTHNYLPGVFEFNNAPGIVNEIFWIIPYLIFGFVVVLFSNKKRQWTTYWLVLTLTLLGIAALVQIGLSLVDPRSFFQEALAGKGLAALGCFLVGALASASRRPVPVDWRLAVVAGLSVLALAGVGHREFAENGLFNLLLVPLLSYLVLYFSLTRLPFVRASSALQPYLAGFLLFAYPVQQFWISVGPGQQSPLLNLAMSVPIAAALAAVCWHLVQRRILGQDFELAFSGVSAADQSAQSATAVGDLWRNRPTARAVVARTARLMPAILVGVALFLISLGLLAMLFYALQRDTPGI